MAANDNYKNKEEYISTIASKISSSCIEASQCASLLKGKCPLLSNALHRTHLIDAAKVSA